MLKHPAAQIGLNLDSGAEEAYPPQETADYDGGHDNGEGNANIAYEVFHVEPLCAVHAVDDIAVQLRNLELEIVNKYQRNRT